MATKSTALDHPSLLRAAGLRVTDGRLALLALLASEREPRTVQELEQRMKGALNQVTLYRALDALHTAGIVARVNLEHEHAHYELVAGRPHHHHAVCRSCGFIEDIEIPHDESAKKYTKQFARIDTHAIELFGICKRCS